MVREVFRFIESTGENKFPTGNFQSFKYLYEFKKQRYYSHTQSFRNKNYLDSRTLSSYVWKMKKTKKETPTLVWVILELILYVPTIS